MLYRNRYRIESSRSQNFNYASNGAYFITICTKDREHFLGKIIKSKMQLSRMGIIVIKCWFDLPNHYSNCILDEFIIMPNHVHGVIIIDNGDDCLNIVETGFPARGWSPFRVKTCLYGNNKTLLKNCRDAKSCVSTAKQKIIKRNMAKQKTNPIPTKYHSLSEMVRAFKTFSARRINEIQNTPGKPIWQPRFYDRIIRNGQELNRIRKYIVENPKEWKRDRNNV